MSSLLLLAVFRDALWANKLLAPLDILPNAFVHFKFMDPTANGIPANHHIIDQVTYDLPLQHLIYENVRKGIIPWWDPYTYGGRPLLADAHINGSDPIRLLCYLTMPFELAYNWNLILKSLFTGLGMFLLLRYLGNPLAASCLFALSFQFAGCFAIFFGHPWIQGAFLYYPYIWLIWDRGLDGRFGLHAAAGAMLSSLVFYSGNLQSHLYLPLFAAAFLAGTIAARSHRSIRAFWLVSVSGVLGFCLAAPALLNEAEFYLLSSRAVAENGWTLIEALLGPLSITGIFPWALGTFRTVDLSKAVGAGSIGFTVFIGTTGAILSTIGVWTMMRHRQKATRSEWTAFFLIVGYFFLISTPAAQIIYTRSSALAVMGLIVLGAFGFRALAGFNSSSSKILGYWVLGLTCALVVALQTALTFYPVFEPLIKKTFIARVDTKQTSLSSLPLRTFQVENLPNEIGVANPEVAAAVFGSMLLGLSLLHRSPSRRRLLLYASLGVSLLSAILFFQRYVPSHPIELWNRLLAGGPRQKAAIEAAGGGLRLIEKASDLQGMVFPNAFGALYRIHTVHGYSALQPQSIFRYPRGAASIPDGWIADLLIDKQGDVHRRSADASPGGSRYRWLHAPMLPISVVVEGVNSLSLAVPADANGEIVRTDTFYPGWVVQFDASTSQPLQKLDACFGSFLTAPSQAPLTITLRYVPRFLQLSLLFCALGAVAVVVLVLRDYCVNRRD